MEKKILILLCLLFLFSPVFADSINNFTATEEVPLNQCLSATGTFVDDNGDSAGVLCAYYILESDGATPVYRASDFRTDGAGIMFLPCFQVKEPILVRGNSYTLRASCGDTTADANFSVVQKQEVLPFIYPQAVGLELDYWLNPENSYAIIFGLIVLSALVIIGYAWYSNVRI